MRALVDTETQTAYLSGVKSTPSFIVGGALLAGAAPMDIWRPILDSIFTVATASAR
jgi:protein-disulfide isomerase